MLIIPIHLDALYLNSDRLVAEATADFSQLPYFDRQLKQEINFDTANISEEIVSQPFQSQNLNLKSGIHLHWALPDALTRGIQTQNGTNFPPVPNRWLVTRKRNAKIEAQWVVESDYLYPVETGVPYTVGKGATSGAIPYYYRDQSSKALLVFWWKWYKKIQNVPPLKPEELDLWFISLAYHLISRRASSNDAPFRYMGRKIPLSAYLQNENAPSPETYLPEAQPLTAVGYGEATFAAFYPNCHSVFGFHDDTYSGEVTGLTYEVMGWHSRPQEWIRFIGSQWPIKLIRKSKLQEKFTTEGDAIWNHLIEQGWVRTDIARIAPIPQRSELSEKFQNSKQLIEESLSKRKFIKKSFFLEKISQEGERLWQHLINQGWLINDIAIIAPISERSKSTLKSTFHDCEQDINKLFSEQNSLEDIDQNEFLEVIFKEFQWSLTVADQVPERFICYAQLTFDKSNTNDNQSLSNGQLDVSIAVGNNSMEALSAFITDQLKEPLGLDNEELGRLEDQLESLHLTSAIANREIDIGENFKRSRHETGFRVVSAGIRWQIRAETQKESSNPAFNSNDSAQPQVILPPRITDQLTQINCIQRQYDQLQQQIKSDRRQVFADWYKYMLSTYHPEDANRGDDYPDVDKVRFFIETKVLNPLDQKIQYLAQLEQELEKVRGALQTGLNAFNQNNGDTRYHLETVPAPRYWQPTEPVILMTGEGIERTKRHGQDGRLSKNDTLLCPVLPLSNNLKALFNQTAQVSDTSQKIDFSQEIVNALQQVSKDSFAFGTWTQNPWNPITLEWEVELLPVKSKTNQTGNGYAVDVITDNYELYDHAIDLEINPNQRELARGSFYSNRCILSSHSSGELKQRIEAYLQKNLFDTYYEYQINESAKEGLGLEIKKWYEGQGPQFSKPTKWYTDSKFLDINSIKTWYETKPTFPKGSTTEDKDKQAQDPIYIAIRAYDQLFEDQNGQKQLKTFLSQALGGFNEELLMHKQTMQLPIEDPLGFAEYRAFTDRVREAVADGFSSAPEPLNQFNPIRSGAIRITRLRLIDSFGQVKDFNHERDKAIITPQRFTTPGSDHLVWLPPRLVQPARVDFRWLSAADETREMHEAANTQPICGWVLPNNLDTSLMFYASDGKALGFLRQQQGAISWQSAPGRNREVDEIPNVHLKQMVNYLQTQDLNFLKAFIATLNQALENIAPENFAQHQSLALLMGRPIAVVRASLNLELQGQPAINQSWDSFRLDLERTDRETDNFTQVQVPVRIGEYRQFNDGVVGYWIEAGNSYQQETFFAPQVQKEDATEITHPKIQLQDADPRNPLNLLQSVDSPPLHLTMLVDPRGVVHVTTGILPVKAITIPAAQYAAALDEIAVTFLTTPILTGTKIRSLPLPVEPGFAWSWLEHQGWIEKQVFVEGLGNPQAEAYWNQLLQENQKWLTATGNSEKAEIVPMGRRKAEKLLRTFNPDQQSDIEDQIERLFWTELLEVPTIDKQTFLKALAAQIWDHLLTGKIGWLKIDPSSPESGQIAIAKQDERAAQNLDSGFAEFSQDIEAILMNLAQPPQVTKAAFIQAFCQSDRQEIWQHLLTINLRNRDFAEEVWDFLLAERIRWLNALNPETAKVVPMENRATPKLERAEPKFSRFGEAIESILFALKSKSSDQKQVKKSEFVNLFCQYVTWLRPIYGQPLRYEIVAKDRRLPENLNGDRFAELEDKIQLILDNEGIKITPANPKAIFVDTQEIREGWLVLRKSANMNIAQNAPLTTNP